jgi:hypothetical protein
MLMRFSRLAVLLAHRSRVGVRRTRARGTALPLGERL